LHADHDGRKKLNEDFRNKRLGDRGDTVRDSRQAGIGPAQFFCEEKLKGENP